MGRVSERVFITGIEGFTGRYLKEYLRKRGFEVFGSALRAKGENIFEADLADSGRFRELFAELSPDYIIHLGAISFVAHTDNTDFYKTNTIGTLNILEAASAMEKTPKKVILASSAAVYGRQKVDTLDEALCPKPANHYGASKYAAETLAANYYDRLPVLTVRPFNYTGPSQAEHFLVPKIVKHYAMASRSIELGNLDVIREYNDIDFVCEIYYRLLGVARHSDTLNICSGRGIALLDIIEMMNEIAGYEIEVKVNPRFVRKDEIKKLIGSPEKLFCVTGEVEIPTLRETLEKIYHFWKEYAHSDSARLV